MPGAARPRASVAARPSGATGGTGVTGTVTRGTTAPNRLRRVDRWTVATLGPTLRAAADPLVVDLGFGASPVTTVELADRLRRLRPDIDVVGVEIDPERVDQAGIHERPGLRFARGGFELRPLGDRRPVLVRAMNVLRQYDEDEVDAAWSLLVPRLAPGGALVEGTCDEIGRLTTWVHLDPSGPVSLTLAAHLGSLDRPSRLAERLPKALIHRNVAGEPVHALLADLDRAWAGSAAAAVFGPRQRWAATLRAIATDWPLLGDPRRRRPGELSVAWSAVQPRTS